MPCYRDVFARTEKKYLIDSDTRFCIESVLRSFMEPDSYGLTRITSLYLDTEHDEVICRSLEKPYYKEKIRLRAYGDEAGDALARAFAPESVRENASVESVRFEHPGDLVFCELKKKFNGVVYKRRMGLSLRAAVEYLGGKPYLEACRAYPCDDPAVQESLFSTTSMQISREMDAALRRYEGLHPRVAIEYARTAWVPCEESGGELCGLRITFDQELRYRAMHAGGSASWSFVVDPDYSVMEIKSSGPLPLWLVDALSAFKAHPRSFTKYGTAYLLKSGLDLKGSQHA